MKPLYYPRAQFTGTLRWTCVYCAKVGENSLRPTAFRTRCTGCGKLLWWGPAAHVPGGVRFPMDGTIPTWAGDEYSFDPIKFDPMPPAVFNPDQPLKNRGRINYLIIHDNIVATNADLPLSPEEAQLYIKRP